MTPHQAGSILSDEDLLGAQVAAVRREVEQKQCRTSARQEVSLHFSRGEGSAVGQRGALARDVPDGGAKRAIGIGDWQMLKVSGGLWDVPREKRAASRVMTESRVHAPAVLLQDAIPKRMDRPTGRQSSPGAR